MRAPATACPVGDTIKLKLDYSVDVIVKPISVGALSVQMADEQPMRVRNRNVGLTIDLARSGLDMIRLDFSAADMEIEDPGLWQVHGPASLFDILGTRSGRGSMWLEVDLRFKLNLGPVKVSGATIRATREDDGSFSASLRGLDASVSVPGAIEGHGKFQLLQGGGFSAELDANLVPLNLAAGAVVLYVPHGESFLLYLKIGVDLPGPIPVANTGLGIYGVAGAFGVNARPTMPPPGHPDPIGFQLAWDSSDPQTAFTYSQDNLTIGAEAVIGTVPDLGFSFSAKAGLFLTIPDLAIRGALWGKVLSPRLKVVDHPSGPDIGLSFKGIVVVDSHDGVTIGLKGELHIPVLVDAVIPLGAHFPFSQPGVDTADWFIYLGADGYSSQARGLGPMRVTVLPDLMPTSADAYLMQRGKGIEKWPRGGPITIADGFVLAFGFSFEYTLGVVGIVWAEVHASLDVLLAQRPLTLAGLRRRRRLAQSRPALDRRRRATQLPRRRERGSVHPRAPVRAHRPVLHRDRGLRRDLHPQRAEAGPPAPGRASAGRHPERRGGRRSRVPDRRRLPARRPAHPRSPGPARRLAGHAAAPLVRRLPQARGGLHGRTVCRDRDLSQRARGRARGERHGALRVDAGGPPALRRHRGSGRAGHARSGDAERAPGRRARTGTWASGRRRATSCCSRTRATCG